MLPFPWPPRLSPPLNSTFSFSHDVPFLTKWPFFPDSCVQRSFCVLTEFVMDTVVLEYHI